METDIQYAHLLYAFTTELAKKNQNAVLSVLEDREIVEEEKYPAQYLQFNGEPWRAYYHFHAHPTQNNNDHGHFHLFHRLTASSEDSWSHVTCLSVDAFGQPMNWTLVNRWVTDGPWLTMEGLKLVYNSLSETTEKRFTGLKPVEGWLLALLGLYEKELIQLYTDRDEYIQNITQKQPLTSMQNDRDIYDLAKKDIVMMDKLKQCLPD